MKNRYLLFFGKYYYPMGGASDLEGAFHDIEKAKEKAFELFEKEMPDYDGIENDMNELFWCHIYDLFTKEKTEVKYNGKENQR